MILGPRVRIPLEPRVEAQDSADKPPICKANRRITVGRRKADIRMMPLVSGFFDQPRTTHGLVMYLDDLDDATVEADAARSFRDLLQRFQQ